MESGGDGSETDEAIHAGLASLRDPEESTAAGSGEVNRPESLAAATISEDATGERPASLGGEVPPSGRRLKGKVGPFP